MSEALTVPALRFPEFEGDWEKKRLGDIATFQRGFDLPSQDRKSGTVPIVSSGGITGFHNEAKVERSGIVTGRYGSIGDLYYVKEPHWPLNTALWVKDFHDNSMDFAFYHLSRVDFAKLSDKTGVPGINRNDLHRLWASTTSLPEQKKIAAFLGVVDAKLAALRDRVALLERYKRGLMQALFSQSLRFTKPDGSAFPDWEEKRLGEICSFIKDGTHGTHKDDPEGHFWLLSAKNIQNGAVLVTPSDRRISESEYLAISKNYALQSGDILLSIVGTIGRVAVFNGRTDVAFQRSVAFFRAAPEHRLFLYHYMTGKQFQRELERRKVVSAQPGIYLGDLAKIDTPIPHPDEQQKIADALSAMDAKIAAVADQVAQMDQFKKGLLQQMFV